MTAPVRELASAQGSAWDRVWAWVPASALALVPASALVRASAEGWVPASAEPSDSSSMLALALVLVTVSALE